MAIGGGSATTLLGLKSKKVVSAEAIYIFIGMITVLYSIFAFFGMKDVVKSTDFEKRRERSDTQKAK